MSDNKFFLVSFLSHLAVLSFFILSLDFAKPLSVFENTNKTDVISAIVVGEKEKTKIVTPQAIKSPPPPVVRPETIALKKAPATPKLKKSFFAKDLLADIQKQEVERKLKQKKIEARVKETLRQQAEESLRQQLLKEKLNLQNTLAREAQGRVDKFTALIIQAMTEHWIIPPQAKRSLKGELMIQLAPGGMVLDVQVSKTSGDPTLDSSARAAVFKASPLPVPKDPAEFENFRKFVLKFTPKDVVSAAG